jgi:hypothetical protein
MSIEKRDLKTLLLSIVAGFLFTIIIYNLKFEVRVLRYAATILFSCLWYILLIKKRNCREFYAALFTIVTPLLIDSYALFVENRSTVPLRFPFASTFLFVGLLLGYSICKNYLAGLSVLVFAIIYCVMSHLYFIPLIIQGMEKSRVRPLSQNCFTNDRFLTEKGDTIRLKNAELVFFDLFFVGCLPCEKKRKMFEEITSEIKDKNFKVIIICDGKISTYKEFTKYCSKLPKKEEILFLYDFEENIEKQFPDLGGFPFEIITKDSKIIETYEGMNTETYELNKKERINIINKYATL